MICKNIKYYCTDYWNIENYEQAKNDDTQIWHCHHKREIDENKSKIQLKNEGLYWNRPATELIFLTVSDHRKLHSGNNLRPETLHKFKTSAMDEKNPFAKSIKIDGVLYECIKTASRATGLSYNQLCICRREGIDNYKGHTIEMA